MKSEPQIIHKVMLASFKNGKLLAVKSQNHPDVWLSVGGKIEPTETPEQALIREVKEELNVDVLPATIRFLHHFSGPAHGKENTMLEMDVFQADFIGKPQPSSEITELGYISKADIAGQRTQLATSVMAWLKERDLVD